MRPYRSSPGAAGRGRAGPTGLGERGSADLADEVVEFVEDRFGALPGVVCGQAFGGLEAEPGVEEAGDDRVQQLQVLLLGLSGVPGHPGEVIESAGSGDVADDGEGELPRRSGHWGEADPDGERAAVLAQPGQLHARAHRPGRRRPRPGGPVPAVRLLKARGHEGLGWEAGHLAGAVAEHILQPRAGCRDRPVAVGQRHRVLERLKQPSLRDRCRPVAVRRLAGAPGPGSRQDSGRQRQPRGGGGVQGWVDRDLPVQAAQAENPRDAPGGDHQPQLRAAADGPLPRPHYGIGAGMIAGDGRGHVRDQRHRAEVDDRQQRIADLPGVGCPDVLGKRDDGLAAGPPDRVEILKHDASPCDGSASRVTRRACLRTDR